MDQGRVGAVIVAAGASARLGVDKMFIKIRSRALLAYTLSAFDSCECIDDIVLVVSEANRISAKKMIEAEKFGKIRALPIGGVRRQDSVLAGLRCLNGCSWVVVHDGARPLVTHELIKNGLDAARRTGAATAGVPVKDTIKAVDSEDLVISTLERSALRAAQTPQVFDYGLLLDAYARVGDREYTDDASVVEAAGHKVVVYPGSYDNIKVTTWEDVELARVIIRRTYPHSGQRR